jgi:hypothetical protein
MGHYRDTLDALDLRRQLCMEGRTAKGMAAATAAVVPLLM